MRAKTVGISGALALAGAYVVNPFVTGGTLASPFCGGDAFRCWFGDCKIPVENITCDTPSTGNYGHIDVQEEFSVCKPSRMVWDTDDHSFTFPATGIQLKAPNSDFDPADADHRDWRFTWRNKHNNLERISYSVTVQKGGADCAHLDPRIYNQ